MRSIHSWLDEYGDSHRNPVNKRVHWVCVPLIVLSLIGLLWSLPVPASWSVRTPFLNWGVLFIALALVYYYALAWRLAIGMTVVTLAVIAIVAAASRLSYPLWAVSAGVFVLAWIGQFIGHKIEGRKPSFFKDIQFLLIGPLWLLAFVYRRAGIGY
ncbi:MAG TPA: Mpo1-like protein [Gammaproteobacteria bacterium]|nr:Mpo1-like protein [Gammaproteobacteria bacterium]